SPSRQILVWSQGELSGDDTVLKLLADKAKFETSQWPRPGVVNFELPIEKHHTNRLNILHGGTIASMVDLGGSLAVASRGLFATGVSTDLNGTSILKSPLVKAFSMETPNKLIDLIRAEVTCDKYMGVLTMLNTVGKTLAYTSILFHNEKQQLVARGSHTKYVTLAWKDPNNIVEEMSPKPEK
ncbi:hypothetical protein E4T44_06986, partial [Aureobasidium sp. EXF-8845]